MVARWRSGDGGSRATRICLSPLLYRVPGTYRRIGDFFITTDPNYEPKGTVHPPITREQYLEKAASLGAKRSFPACFGQPRTSIAACCRKRGRKRRFRRRHRAISLKMAADSFVPPTLFARRDGDDGVDCRLRSPVRERRRRSRQGFFAHDRFCSPTPRNFAKTGVPFCLLRRPFITVPPYNVAGIWLTVDSRGLPAGDYTSDVIVLRSKGTAPRYGDAEGECFAGEDRPAAAGAGWRLDVSARRGKRLARLFRARDEDLVRRGLEGRDAETRLPPAGARTPARTSRRSATASSG